MNYLDFFKEISKIPHGSHNTDKISDYLVEFAASRNLWHMKDSANNVIIVKEATPGYEDKEPVIIQGHMDMVAVKDDDCNKDMLTEGLDIVVDDDFIYAKGTSLGGDDGIAVAYALQLLDSRELKHPRLEVVITTDEEVGMLGAVELDLSMLKGHTLLNLDSEEEGIFLTSCAGGSRIDISYPLKVLESTEGLNRYRISISGLTGGHSGTEIHRGRANAIVLMGRIVSKLVDARLLVGIEAANGGTADNAIANFCEMTVASHTIEPELFDIIKFEVMEEYLSKEPEAKITLEELSRDYQATVYNIADSSFDKFITAQKDGVVAMSAEVEGLVETSLNHGLLSMEEGNIVIGMSVRSNINEHRDNLVKSIVSHAGDFGAQSMVYGEYPGWAYRADSPLRDKMISMYREMYKCDPQVRALHAGLECGVLASKISDLDCVSFGPNIYDIHTTKEKLSLSSAERVWEFVTRLLSEY